MLILARAIAEIPPAPPVTLNPSDKGASISLSGGNLVATSSSGWDSVRSTGARSGKS